ncbi:MAG: UDP-N-acetylmuramoyl-L-alanine--D-glutamate ligase, partial [Clostridia bacterium]
LFVRKAKTVVTMGVTGEKIRNILKNVSYDGNVFSASDMSDAVKKAESVAKNGDIIILSPAAASFDMYKNFDERGNAFISEVKNDL